MMSLLGDREIDGLLRSSPSLIEDFDPSILGTPSSPVRGASLELTVGEIFLAGTDVDELGGVNSPRKEISLRRGQTAVVRTRERIHLPKHVAGVGFPPSTDVSLAGLLTTNPGLIDPDYEGYLHLTVVNMGSEAFSLSRGDRILRVMLFQLSEPARRRVGKVPEAVTQELLTRLSDDFMDVDARAGEISRRAISEADFRIRSRQLWFPLVGTMLTGLFAAGYYIYFEHAGFRSELAKLQGQLSYVSSLETLGSVNEKLGVLPSIEERLRALEEAEPKQIAPQGTPKR